MKISVLGPLRVTIAGRVVPLPAKQRTLLAILAFQPTRTVSTDRLIGALWGEDASPTAIKTLQSHVFQLRRLLAPDAGADEYGPTIVTEGRGYRLSIDPMAIDARAFERLLEQGRVASTADPQRAFGLLQEALALWRGPGVAEVGDEPLATAEIERLGELRASAFDEFIQIRLALADYDGAIPELRRELSESPFREQLWASLMVALVRSGRKAEALLAYRDAKTALRRELDVEPSHELQELAARIRDGDTSLVPAAEHPPRGADRTVATRDRAVADSSPVGITSTGSGVAVGADRGAGGPSSSSRGIVHRRWGALKPSVRRPAALVAVLSVVLIATLLTARPLLHTSTPGPTSSTPATSTLAAGLPVVTVVTDSVGRMDGSGRLVANVRVGAQPDAIALGAGSAWVTNATDDAVTRLDASGSTVIQRIPVGGNPAGIAFGFGAVWVANSGDRTVSRIDPTTNEVVAVIPVGTAPASIATDDRSVWVTNRLDHTLSRIDPNDGSTKTFAVGATPLGVATAAGSVWVADSDSSLVIQVDAQSGAVRHEVFVGNGPSAIAATPRGDAV
jgi:40-residue YVTN family beta-propeller repeat